MGFPPHSLSASKLAALRSAERQGHPFLAFKDGGDELQIAPLGELDRITIGRSENNELALTWDPEVSRTHAQLELVGDDWTIVDDGLSRNGTFLNGERVRGRNRLRDGDRLCFGETIVAYCAPRDSESQSTLVVATNADVEVSETQRKVLAALCAPLGESAFALPATNREIAEQLFLSVDAVKAHLRVLFERFGLQELPQNQKRASLAATVLLNGVVKARDL